MMQFALTDKQGMECNGMENGKEWNGNFGMEYGRCQNGMEGFKDEMENNFPYFHTNFKLDSLDFTHSRKIIH